MARRVRQGGAVAAPVAEVDERIARLCREEDVPGPDGPALHAELASARRDGWLVSSSFQPGRTSVAAPVVRADGEPVGGLSVAGPSALFPPAVVRRLGPQVADAARHAGQALGARARNSAHGHAERL